MQSMKSEDELENVEENENVDFTVVKENRTPPLPLSALWLCACATATAVALLLVMLLEQRLPTPLTRSTAPTQDRFIAEIAQEHLHNLTAIGPRVAGSYQNEVEAVRVIVEALRHIRRQAAPHHRIDIDLHRTSGAFPITFLDGMSNVYRGVQSVVARVSSAGGRGHVAGGRGRERALLLNCHYDTVPDSPGASDDAAGCAVLLETIRALTATRAPHRHAAIFLFNGAEENIMQASHGFITQHKWAKEVRAFINIEACGAGGREVLFQAGPRDPWIMEVYSSVVPHPFASSLAQEIFESGAVPGDTDFRIFRDFGNLSGVDLAWSSNGYVYHTALDVEQRVPLASLQRTGDNIQALAHGMLSSVEMVGSSAGGGGQVVFFDVLGGGVVCMRADSATLCAVTLLALLVYRFHLTSQQAKRDLYMSGWSWSSVLVCWCMRVCASWVCGVTTAVATALLLHVVGARLAWYRQVALLVPLYAIPAVLGSWWCLLWLTYRTGQGGALAPLWERGWWGARGAGEAVSAGWGVVLFVCVLLRLRSGYLPALWVAAAAADIVPSLLDTTESRRWFWCACMCAVPILQSWYLAVSSLLMFVPIMGRVGDNMPDVVLAVVTAMMTLGATSWMLPLVLATRGPYRIMKPLACLSSVCVLAVMLSSVGAPYSVQRPQRFMMFHTRVTEHPPLVTGSEGGKGGTPRTHVAYWLPTLDANTDAYLNKFAKQGIPELSTLRRMSSKECSRRVYCGAPYYLPALSLLPSAQWMSTDEGDSPLVTVTVSQYRVQQLDEHTADIYLTLEGPSHIVVIVAPVSGARVTRSSLMEVGGGTGRVQQGASWYSRWGRRDTYFMLLHDATAARDLARWHFTLTLQKDKAGAAEATDATEDEEEGEWGGLAQWASLSVSGHALWGPTQRAKTHAHIASRFPHTATLTGWGVDLHLLHL